MGNSQAAMKPPDGGRELRSDQIVNLQAVIKPPEPAAAAKIWPAPETVEHPKVRQVLQLLKDDMIGTVAIWGMGGVGKTYILQQVYNHPSIATAGFDLVIWWPLNHSQKQQLDIKALQVELAKLIGLIFPDYPTHYATKIYEFLNPKKFLLLMDGLWSWIDLKDIGVPHAHAKFGDILINPNHKVIFTTQVNSFYFGMRPPYMIRIDPLDWKASWLLFQKTFGEQVLCTNHFLQMRAVTVVEKCGGLPLALIAAARAMSSMEWEEVMSMPEILHLRDICGERNELFPLLKLSYDNLENDNEKECFLLCSLWPENFPIPRIDLVMCWMGHGLLNNWGYGTTAFGMGDFIVRKFVNNGLLEFAKTIDGRVHVHMRGVIRELALWIASKEKSWIVCAGVGVKEAPHQSDVWKNVENMSLMYNKIQSLPSHPNCPNLSVLMLQHNYEIHIPDEFFQSMPSLAYLDLSSTTCQFSPSIPHTPPNLSRLLQLRYLNLSRTMIESLPEEIGSLSTLEYLILSETRYLRSIPRGLILKLRNLLLLDLYASHYVIAADDISERSKMRSRTALGATITTASDLQRLYGDNNVGLWRLWMKDLEGITSLNLFEIFVQTKPIKHASLSEFTLSSCTSLEEFIMTDESLFGKIGFQNLEEFITAEANPFMMHGFQSVQVLTLLDLPKLERVSLGNWPYFIIRSLTISSCSKLKNFNWIKELKSLEHLSLESCYGMEQVINDNAVGDKKSIFFKLKSLSLQDLPNLEFICSYARVLPRLVDFRVIACPKLKWLPVSFEIVHKRFFGIQIKGSEQWWEDLVWEAYSIKPLLRPYFKADAS